MKNNDIIMKDIENKLSGDLEKDILFVNAQAKTYQNNKEVLRDCKRLLSRLLSEYENNIKSFRPTQCLEADIMKTLDEVKLNLSKKDYSKALGITEDLITDIEYFGTVEENEFNEFLIFDETFEEILYWFLFKPQKKICQTIIPYTNVYLTYGSILIILGKYKEARMAIEKALRWNPVNFEINRAYNDTYRFENNWDKFYQLTLDIFKIAFTPKNLAICFSNLGTFFLEKEKYPAAIACYFLSLEYDDKEYTFIQSQLFYISTITNKVVEKPSWEEMKKLSKEHRFPLYPNEDVLSLAYYNGIKALQENKENPAKYFLSIYFNLTQDKDVKEILETLE